MKISAFAALAALGVTLSGCATVVKGTTEFVKVTTVPPAPADCVLHNREGQWHTTAPGTVKVARSSSPLQVDCDAPGYAPGHATANAHFNGVTLGNVVVGGLIGVGVDAATGANHSYDDVSVTLGPPEVAEAPMTPPVEAQKAPAPVAPRVAAEPAPPTPPANTPDTGWHKVPPVRTAMPDDSYAPAQADEPPPWGEPPG